MVIKTHSALLIKGQVQPIEIEVDCRPGIPQLILIGLATQALHEARERLLSALHNCGVRLKSKRTIINLSPTELKKTSPYLDLAIAVALLQVAQAIPPISHQVLWLGELTLGGEVKTHPDLAQIIKLLPAKEYEAIVTPALTVNTTVPLHLISHMRELLVQHGNYTTLPVQLSAPQSQLFKPDFAQIQGQNVAKRALTIAIAGGHHCLLMGPPGVGKTLLLDAAKTLLPTEILTLDSLQDASPTNLLAVKSELNAPSPPVLLASSQLCPCGAQGSSVHPCRCSDRQLKEYLSHVSGPLLEHWALSIRMEEEGLTNTIKESSQSFLKRITTARQIQHHRYQQHTTNAAALTLMNFQRYLTFTATANTVWKKLQTKTKNPRQLQHLLSVCRTIADLDQTEQITDQHLWEAVAYQLPTLPN